MSGGPPSHHSHGLPSNAWNHLQIPNYFPGRQPQHAHMSSEHPLLHQPTWHTPTTEPVKTLPHSHLFNLEQMLNTRHSPGVDLSLATRNGASQNGEIPQAPISLSVRDARQINSLPVGALDASDITSPPKKRTDSLPYSSVVRLNAPMEKPTQSIIVSTANSSHDENSNSSNAVQEDEDSLDSSKSRRKRKPFKTVRLNPSNREEIESNKEVPSIIQKQPETQVEHIEPPAEVTKSPEITKSYAEEISTPASVPTPPPPPPAPPLSEIPEVSITEAQPLPPPPPPPPPPVTTELNADSSQLPPEPEKETSPQKDSQTTFVAVEDELEKMFAGIAETKTPSDSLETPSTSQTFDGVTSTSNEVSTNGNKTSHKRGRPKGSKNGSRRSSVENMPKKKHKGLKKKEKASRDESPGKTLAAVNKALLGKNSQVGKKTLNTKKSSLDNIKDVYAYDSGSNTSSTKSKGPFVQIRGPRDSPISVSIVNGPANDDDHSDKKAVKTKKFHDDSEYRHKVRSKGLHSSTLSNKYDAQTKDVTWICVFCKRGPHATAEPATLAPGDLFGPYIITTDCSEYQRRLNDPFDLLFKSKKLGAMKKAKRKHNDSETGEADVLEGMTEASSNSYEVWTHEDCVIWSPGVYLVGPKIVGLEGAVWGACSVGCARCGMKGAAVCCLRRGCGAAMHVGCARLSSWHLDEDTYKTYCEQHRPM